MRKQVGIVVMGQSEIKGKYDDIDKILAPEAEARVVGIMDGYTFEQIKKEFWPTEGEDFIISNIIGGETVKIAERHAHRLIQEKIEQLEGEEIGVNMVFCTAEFPTFKTRGILMQPAKVIDSVLKALDTKRIGIILPEKAQMEESFEQYKKYDPIIRAASPYGSKENIAEAAMQFAEENVDLILTDCMGFNEELSSLIHEKSGKRVIVPRILVPKLLKILV